MASQGQHRSSILGKSLQLAIAAFVLAIGFATQSVEAQTFNIIYPFNGSGFAPIPGLTRAGAGHFYGVGFELTHRNSGWIFHPLYSGDGTGSSLARVTVGPNGVLYGTTWDGGDLDCAYGEGCGTLFTLRPQSRPCASVSCPWNGSILFYFNYDRARWPYSDVNFDKAGNLYGTTLFGFCCGTVYEMAPPYGDLNVIHEFNQSGLTDGSVPTAGVIFDQAGNLYGTTFNGGIANDGTVYQMTPSASGWTESVLYSFQNGSDGEFPYGGVILDAAGNIYGTTAAGGSGGGGTIFMLTPSNGSWTYTLLYSLDYAGQCASWNIFNLSLPGALDSLVMDAAGNLYGTEVCSGTYGQGSVFKLTHGSNGWTYTSLHDFTGGSDGAYPFGNVIFDTNGKLYGLTASGIFEITP